MASDKSVFDIRRKISFIQQEKFARDIERKRQTKCSLGAQRYEIGQALKSCLQLREVQNYLASEEFEHLRNKLESDRICNRGFWQKNVHQENRFFRVLDLLIYLGKRTSSVAII